MTLSLLLQQQPGGLGGFGMLIPLLLIFLVFYFFIIRPQKKREKERQAMITAVRKHDRIVTAGGIHGTITSVDESSVLVEVATNVKLRIDKTGIGTVTPKK